MLSAFSVNHDRIVLAPKVGFRVLFLKKSDFDDVSFLFWMEDRVGFWVLLLMLTQMFYG